MIELTTLPSSIAEPLDQQCLHDRNNDNDMYTFTEFVDEQAIYSDVNKKLNKLETSTYIGRNELDSIILLAEQIQMAQEEKEEVFTRIGWLQRLYKAESEMDSVDTKEKIKQLRNFISPVQTCPLKTQLLAELESLEAQLPVEATIELTAFDLLMEKAIKEIGNEFSNLGKVGREYVIAEVLMQEGDHATTAHVQDLAYQLEQRVLTLSEVSDWVEMIAELDQLPLSVFPTLQDLKKERVAEALIQEKGWTGLFSLERKITQISNAIDREEREKYEKENVIDLPDGKAAATLDLRYNPID